MTINRIIVYFLTITFFFIPFRLIAIEIFGYPIEPSYIFGGVTLFIFLMKVFYEKSIKFPIFGNGEKLLFVFIAMVTLSLIIKQIFLFDFESLTKGIRQLVGILFMSILFFIVRSMSSTPEVFVKLYKALLYSMFLLAIFGVWQFFAFNFLNIPIFANWSFVNILSPSVGGWGHAGKIGSLYRVNSFAPEAATYSQYLIMVLGVILFSFFPNLVEGSNEWKKYVPSYGLSAFLLVAFLLSFSDLGYFGLIVMILTFGVFYNRIKYKSFISYVILFLILISMIFFVNKITNEQLGKKALTIRTLLDEKPDLTDKTLSLSSLVLVSNWEVAKVNLSNNLFFGCGIGGHPAAFSKYAPFWVLQDPYLSKLNTQDAGGLLIRLLSETGLLGLLVYSLAFFLIIKKAWISILNSINSAQNYLIEPIIPICAGITISGVSMFFFSMVRVPSYYNPSWWLLFGLVSATPSLLRTKQALLKNSDV